MKRAYGYARTATIIQAKESNSIKNQIKRINDYCKKSKIKLLEIFADKGKSGRNLNRPDFKKMLRQIKKDGVDCIVITEISRLSRNFSEYMAIKGSLRRLGIDVLTISDTKQAPEGPLLESIMEAINTFNSELYKAKRNFR